MLCHVALRHVTSRHVMLCRAMSCRVMSCHFTSRHVMLLCTPILPLKNWPSVGVSIQPLWSNAAIWREIMIKK